MRHKQREGATCNNNSFKADTARARNLTARQVADDEKRAADAFFERLKKKRAGLGSSRDDVMQDVARINIKGWADCGWAERKALINECKTKIWCKVSANPYTQEAEGKLLIDANCIIDGVKYRKWEFETVSLYIYGALV